MSKLDSDIRLIAASGLFDTQRYVEEHRDVALLEIDPIEHCIRYGAALGRNPGPHFDTRFYLGKYKDVAKSGMNPLVHYLRYGKREGRSPAPVGPSRDGRAAAGGMGGPEPGGDAQVTDMHGRPIRLSPRPAFAGNNPSTHAWLPGPCLTLPPGRGIHAHRLPDVGVHAHVHYVELARDLVGYLGNIPGAFSLYISVESESARDAVAQLVQHKLPLAKPVIKILPNRGRDIAPFLCGFGQELGAHELIAHIHTKRSPHNGAKLDWRQQLLTNLMGSAAIVDGIFSAFEANPQLGMIFPQYHQSLRGQISWGSNFEVCQRLATRLGIAISEEAMHLFPAGSMFWARPGALAPLLQAGLDIEDFPREAGQVDGTLAHAIERMFGEVVHSTGHAFAQVMSEKPHELIEYFPHKWPYPESRVATAASAIADYRSARNQVLARSGPRVVVFTAIAGGYERLLPYEQLDPSFDYVAFSDTEIADLGYWQVRPMDYWSPNPVRMARYIKSHPHKYFGDYDFAIWVDANVVVRGDLSRYVERLASQPGPVISGIPHPVRDCLYDEATAVMAAKKDSIDYIGPQLEEYRKLGYPEHQGLIETNLMITRLGHPDAERVMADWWREIDRHSHRDQLSLNFVLWKHNATWMPLLDERRSLRDSFDFAYFGHGRNSGFPNSLLEGPLGGRTVAPYSIALDEPLADDRPSVDVVICVHNALDEVRKCLDSVLIATRAGDRIILVDDASEAETADYLRAFRDRHGAELIRNEPPARGYCKAANIGMAAVMSEIFLLLNSDTILPRGALDKMARLIASNDRLGIVGPMSNAASMQSLPNIAGGPSQTAINALPEGMTTQDMDEACEAWSYSGIHPSVPLVHGFCQMIRKRLIDQVGGFDEALFPHGYGEENDLCFRAVDAGYDLKIATNSYVYHTKSASYTDDVVRQRLMREGLVKLREKHSPERVARAIRTMEGNALLVRMREQALPVFGRNGVEA